MSKELTMTSCEARVLVEIVPEDHPYQIGGAYLIRTVTNYFTGRVLRVTRQEIVIGDAAWIADTRRFGTALAQGFSPDAEIEPYPDGSEVIVGRGALVDASPWRHALPRVQQ